MVRISPQDEDKVKEAVLAKLKEWLEGYGIDNADMEILAYNVVEAIKEA